MTAKPANRFRAFYLRQIAKGLKAVWVWVPKNGVQALKDFAKGLREIQKEKKP